MTTSSCPTADQLRELLGGSSPAAEQAELIAHLDECADCQRTLEGLAGANPTLLNAASDLHRNAYVEEASRRRVLDDLARHATLTILYHSDDRTPSIRLRPRPAIALDSLGPFDHYQVTELLGQGGMGLVVKAFDPGLKRWVAIKALAPDLAADPVARQRFAREARAAAAVRHANVITIYAVSETNGLPYFVMEYLAGGSLQDYLDRHGPPDWRAVAALGAQIAAGLAAAHEHGLVHRDVKPSNILLEVEGTPADLGPVKISDFGLARVADEARLTQPGVVTGTPMYMAPEQALCETVDARADLFSLGSVLYTLCTGREPFTADTPLGVLRQVCETAPRPIRQINGAVPDWLAAIIERLHAKRPADRIASAAEVAELLRYNLEHPESPRLVARPHTAEQRRASRRRLLAALLSAGLLLAACLTLSESLGWTHWTGWGKSGSGANDSVPRLAIMQGHEGTVWSVAFSPDGLTLATGSDDTTLRLWDVATGKEQALLAKHGGAVFAVAFAHTGKFLVSGNGDGTLRIWDIATQKEQPKLPRSNGNVRRIALSPDDQTLAVTSSSQGVELWDLKGRRLRLTLPGHQGSILAIAFAPNGESLATGDAKGTIWLWDPVMGDEQAHFRGDPFGVRALAFSPDSQTLASAGTGDKDVKLWRIAIKETTATFSGFDNGVPTLAISPDGRLLATASRDGVVKLWDLETTRPLATWHAHQGNIWAVAFSPDSHELATAGEDRLARLWDVRAWSGAQR